MADLIQEGTILDPEVMMLNQNKRDAFAYRQRRDEEWTENYTLSRDKVTVNRLTQRQTVHLPVMKTVQQTVLKDVDDMPVLYFENLDSDKQAELFKNEYWKIVGEKNKFELQDIIDKKQVIHFGRSYDQWQIIDGFPSFTIIDPRDILVPRYNDPVNIDNNRYLIHTHIFVPLATLKKNKDYDQDQVAALEEWYKTQGGVIKQADNAQMLIEKNQILQDLGVQNVENPITGETYVELSLHFLYQQDENDAHEQLYLYVEAENQRKLMKKPLEEVIGKTKDHYWQSHFPYDTWGDEPEKQDWYTDGIADIVRPVARIVNVWWSQLVENRTMRSFGMNMFNSSLEGFQPQTWEPKAWGWYGIPVPQGGNLKDVFQRVDIPDLGESLDEMNFAIAMIEKATGATATQQGQQTERQVTLGEVQLALGEAKERIKGMSKFYTQVWKERGEKFIKLLEAGEDKLDAVKIYKKGRMTDAIYSREVAPDDWKSIEGYRCRVWSQAEKNEQDVQALEKASAIKTNMPDNPVVDTVYKRKLLEFGDYTPDEVNEAMKYEDEKRNAMMAAQAAGMPQQGMPPVQPGAPVVPGQAAALPQPQMQLGGGK